MPSSNCASVSPGKPAMTSVPIAASGSCSRMTAHSSRTNPVVYLRRIRRSTSSCPAWIGMWRCGHSTAESRSRRTSRGVTSGGSIELSRMRGTGGCSTTISQEIRQLDLRLEVGPIAAEMHAGEHHFLKAALRQHLQLLEHLPRRHAAAAAARERHDAEAAEEVAPLLDLEEGARLAGEALRAERLHAPGRAQIIHQDTLALLSQARRAPRARDPAAGSSRRRGRLPEWPPRAG